MISNITIKKSACRPLIYLFLLVTILLLFGGAPIFAFLSLFLLSGYFLVKNPEIIFSLFLLVNLFKEEPHLAGFMMDIVDPVIALGVFLIFVIFCKIIRKNFFVPHINYQLLIPLACFFAIFIFGIFYTLSPEYGMDKLLRIFFIIGLMIIAPYFVIDSRQKLSRFLCSLVFISSILIIISITTTYQTAGCHSVFGADYLALGRVTGMTALIIAYYFFAKGRGIIAKFFWIMLFFLNMSGMIYTGGRMPVIAFALSVIFVTLINFTPRITKYQNNIIKIGVFGITIACASILFFPSLGDTFLKRMDVLLYESGGGDSFQIRMQLYKDALQAFGDNPFLGVGTGGFSYYSSGVDQRLYPHNIFLEIMAETGIIGLSLFFILLVVCINQIHSLNKKIKEKENYYILTTVCAVASFFFFNAMVSGDISDNRLLFFWITLPFCLNRILISEGQSALNLT